MANEPIVVEKTLKARVDTVWSAITGKEEMKKWYFDLAAFRPEVGFEFQFEGGPDHKKYLHLCKVTEVVPNKKLTYSWRYDGYEGNSFVTFELFPEGEKTRLRLTHSALETFPANPDFAKQNFVAGWDSILLENLCRSIWKTNNVIFLLKRMAIQLQDISIRTNINPGDLGYVIYLHGKLYKEEYDYGVEFEMYVAKGLAEFFTNYDDKIDRVWICEHDDRMIGFLLLVHRENNAAQLRYFLILSQYRGIGLGKKLMELYMDFFRQCNYSSSYLWTTKELHAAASLYKRYGFTLTQEFESSAFGKNVTEQRYDLNVSTVMP